MHSSPPRETSSGTANDIVSEAEMNSLLRLVNVLQDEGILALECKKYEKAAQNFSQVAETYSHLFGATSPRCAGVLFRYGQALYQSAVEKANVFGESEKILQVTGKREQDLLASSSSKDYGTTNPKKQPMIVFNDDEDDDADDNDNESSEKASKEEITEEKDSADAENESSSCESAAKKVRVNENTDLPPCSNAESDMGVDALNSHDDDYNGNDPLDEQTAEDDLAIAIEVLDISRVIYEMVLRGEGSSKELDDLPMFRPGQLKDNQEKNISARVSLRLAEVRNTLGDVCLEVENFEQAAEEFTAALVIQKELMAPDNRAMAETHYKLALAHEYTGSSKLEDALLELSAARHVMGDRHCKLVAMVKDESGTLKNSSSSPSPSMEEMIEIEDLLPELDLKIEDLVFQLKAATGSSTITSKSVFGGTITGEGSSAGSSNGNSGIKNQVGNSSFKSSCVGESSGEVAPAIVDLTSLVRKKIEPLNNHVSSEEKRKRKHSNGSPVSIDSLPKRNKADDQV